MKITKIYNDYDYRLELGKKFCIVVLSELGLDKDSNDIFSIVSNHKNIRFTGDIFKEHKELNTLINKLIKYDPAINVYIDLAPLKNVKFNNNVTYNLLIHDDYMYPKECVEYYTRKNTRIIISKEYIQEFMSGLFLPKEKIYILLKELNHVGLRFCHLNGFNFLYDHSMIKELLKTEEDENDTI